MPGENLLTFRPRVSGIQQVTSVTVHGWDPKNKQSITGSASSPELRGKIGFRRDDIAGRLGGGEVHVVDQPVNTKKFPVRGTCLDNAVRVKQHRVARFKGFGADLPAFTQFVVNLSRSVRSQGYIYLIFIGGAFATFTYFKKRSRKFREYLDRLSLKIPVVGDILTKSARARSAS